MKKHYILRVVFLSILLSPCSMLFGQPMPAFQPFQEIPLYSWEGPYESYEYRNPRIPGIYNLRFRMLKPNGWASSGPNDKFPLIVFLHGSGESGGGNPDTQNNSRQLQHGGQTHMNAVLNGTFPGFLLYPQMRKTGPDCNATDNYATCPFNNWNREWREAVRYIIDKLILDYKVDPNRIYIHGLSGGGESTWQFITDYPEYFAAAHPMSAAGDEFHTTSASGYKEYYKHIPLRLSQGGLDTNPTPLQGNALVTAVRGVGGSIRYDYYPSTGHGTWNSEYAKPDFFSWLLSKRKNQIHVFNEQPLSCPGDPVNVKIGFSRTIYPDGRDNFGFGLVGNRNRIINYEWARGNTSTIVATGATVNEITVTTAGPYTPGTYYGRFQRADGVWTSWSDPVVIDNSRGPSTTPTISSNGKSTALPSLDGSNSVLLYGDAAKAAYQWKLEGTDVAAATNVSLSATQAGHYTVITKDPPGNPFQFDDVPTEFRPATTGCFSLPSAPVKVTTSNGLGVPAPPGNFFACTGSPNNITVSWDDRSSDEAAFEIYRSTSAGSGYQLISILPSSVGPNPQSFTDNNVQANTTYYYRMRTVNEFGGSTYTPVSSATTVLDGQAPSAPIVTLGGTLRTTVLLQWSGSTDNVNIVAYDIYQNGALVASVNGSANFFEAKNLVALSTYNFFVKARDLAGNESAPSNLITATARNSGLLYKYYHHNNISNTAEIGTGTITKVGFISSFSTSARTRSDGYAFSYEGFINVQTAGNHTFSLQTDEGSRMWVNNVLVINHDGEHTCTKATSSTINLAVGWYPIRVDYFENTGAECLTVRWTRPGSSEQSISSTFLTETVASPPSVSNPSNLQATSVSYNQVGLSWADNSSNETGFEIYRLRSQNGTGSYQVVQVTGPGVTSWVDNTVEANSSPFRYYYRVRAINATNVSSTVNMNSPGYVETALAPPPPPAPVLSASAFSPTQINLDWDDVSNETNYELQRSSNNSTGFATIATIAANISTYSDLQLSGNSTTFYRVRSIGLGGATSTWSNVASTTTSNRAPVLTDIPDQTLWQNSATPQTIRVSVTDADNDPISFQFVGLPAQATFESNDYGQGLLSFVNVPPGTYNVQTQASDGSNSVNDSFVLTVNTNRAPVISALTANAVAVTPTPIVAVQNQSVEAGRRLTLVFTVTDPNTNSQLTLTPTITNLPAFATSVWAGTGTANRTLTLTFNTGIANVGIFDNITITFRDNAGGLNVQTFSLVVIPFDPFYSISLNFIISSAVDDEGAPWNNTGPKPGTPRTLVNLKDDLGNVVKDVSFVIPGKWTATPKRKALPADPNAIYTKKVRESFYIRNTGAGGTDNKTFKFTNLNPSIQYRVTCYSAIPGNTGGVINNRYTVTGAGSIGGGNLVQVLPDLNVVNNTTQTRTSNYMYPTTAGELQVNIRGTAANSYFYVNAMVLEASYIAQSPPLPPSDVVVQAPLNNRVNVSWQDNSLNEVNFRIYRATAQAGPFTQVGTVASNITSFSDLTVTGRTTYFYKVLASNTFGDSPYSDPAVITTPNGVPVVANPGTKIVTAGQTIQFNISATDPEGDPLEFAVLNFPSFGTLVDNGDGTGNIKFVTTNGHIGPYVLKLRVTDAYTASSEAEFSLVVSDPDVSEAVYINLLSTSTASAGAPWNNKALSSDAVLLNNLGATSSMTFSHSTTSNWGASDNVGVGTGTNAGVYPDRVMESGWTTTQTSSTTNTIALSGLDVNKRYNISVFGSRNEFWFANTIYRINNGTPSGTDKTLNTRKNKTNVIRFTGIQPTTGGQIVLSMRKDPEDYNPAPVAPAISILNRDGTINAVVIEAYTPGTPRRPSNLVASGLSKTSIRLTWFDNASNETGFEIQRASDPAGPFSTVATLNTANLETWDDTGLPQNRAYVYRVRAIKTSSPASNSEYSNTSTASTFNSITLVNINGTTIEGHPQAPVPWNNLSTTAGSMNTAEGFTWNNFKDDTFTPTATGMHVIYYGNGGIRTSGYNVAGGLYPVEAVRTAYLFLPNDPPSEWELQHLDLNYAFDLLYLSSDWERSKEGNKIVTDFTVGGSTQSLFNAKNNTERVSFNGIRPEQDSTIYFQVKANTAEVIYNGLWNVLEVRSYTPLEAAFDNTAPTAPTALSATHVASDSLRLNWNASTDNVGVVGYEVFRNSVLYATVPTNTARITGLTPSTSYQFTVRARDLKGNRSGFSNTVNVTTAGAGGRIAAGTNANTETQAKAEVNPENAVQLFPNPANHTLFIAIDPQLINGSRVRVAIINAQGQTIGNEVRDVNGNVIELDVQNLKPGLYNVIVPLSSGKALRRFVKE